MKRWLKLLPVVIGILLLAVLWSLYFHNEAVVAHSPRWIRGFLTHLGQHKEELPEEDEDPDNSKNEIPVHVGKVVTATLHRYIDGYGMVAPRLPREGQPPASAGVASPVAGVVSKIAAYVGQKVSAGDPLVMLDDRLAKAAEDQAEAALSEAKASLAALNAAPRPEQVQMAQLTIEKAKGSVDFAQKAYDRQKVLAADQGTPTKTLEQAALDLAAAKNDMATAQNQLNLLQAAPIAEALAQENAKVRQAEAALAAVKMQRQMLTITAPIDGTVTALPVSPGESADIGKTLVQLVAMDRLMVDVDVPADQLPAKAEGLAAHIFLSTAAADDPGMSAKVTFVSPEIEAKNGSVMVGIDLPPDANLRPGLSVRVQIVAQEHKDVVAVPREAVFPNENGDPTIALVNGEQAVHRAIKTGLTENGLIEITSDGISEGASVVTSGAFGLQATQATHVKIVE